ncbi:MAG: hypothetical protein HUJ63_10370, partial [Enterococcus sp.]|nr:hypothetical protein [Enterococcus sp.]
NGPFATQNWRVASEVKEAVLKNATGKVADTGGVTTPEIKEQLNYELYRRTLGERRAFALGDATYNGYSSYADPSVADSIVRLSYKSLPYYNRKGAWSSFVGRELTPAWTWDPGSAVGAPAAPVPAVRWSLP